MLTLHDFSYKHQIMATLYAIPKPKEPHLLREWVKYVLRLKGITLTALANQHGARRDATSIVFLRPSPKWEKIIADAVVMMPEELWPERYTKRAARKTQTLKRKSTRKTRGAQ